MTAKELSNKWRSEAEFIAKNGQLPIATPLWQCANDLDREMEHPSDFLCPTPELKDKVPVVVYFHTSAEADDFVKAIEAINPNLRGSIRE